MFCGSRDGRGLGRMDSCMYGAESLGYPLETLTALLICCACNCLSRFSHIWLCNPMDCSPSDSSVHGILQARILEWVAIPFSRGSSWSRDQSQVSRIAGRFFTIWATRGVKREHWIAVQSFGLQIQCSHVEGLKLCNIEKHFKRPIFKKL